MHLPLWTPHCSAGLHLLCSTEPHKPGISTCSPPLATLNILLRQNCRSFQREASSGVSEAASCFMVVPSWSSASHKCAPLLKGWPWLATFCPSLALKVSNNNPMGLLHQQAEKKKSQKSRWHHQDSLQLLTFTAAQYSSEWAQQSSFCLVCFCPSLVSRCYLYK